MKSIRETEFYSEVRKELNLPYADVYFFDHFLVSEIHADVLFTWELAKPIVYEATSYYENSGEKIIYISNRIHPYTVKAVDWLLFIKYSFKLGGYVIISGDEKGARNAIFESLFIPTKFKVFNDFYDAIQWAATIHLPSDKGSH